MQIFIVLCITIVLICSDINQACQLDVDDLDTTGTIRHVYEQDLFYITGRLRFCPRSLTVVNISTLNEDLIRFNIINVTFLIETNQFNVSGIGRLIGFTPLTIEFYFRENLKQKSSILLIEHQSNDSLTKNSISIDDATDEQRQCALVDFNRDEILRSCSKIQFRTDHYVLSEKIRLAVKRRQTIIDTFFTGVVLFLVTMGTLCIGCRLNNEMVFDTIKRPLPLIIGLCCQIIYVPLLSFGLTKLFRFDPSNSLGLISTASSPGGASSNIFTALLAGDVDLSMTMTFFSTTFAFGSFPFWIYFLNKNNLATENFHYPWWHMLLSFVTLLLPALIGIFLRRYRPVLAYRIGQYLNPIVIAYLLFLMTFGVYINKFLFNIIDYKSIVVCCFLPWFGFIGGGIFSFIFIRERKKIIAICIETGIHNTAVSIVFLRLTFSQPESDLALTNPILVSMAIPIPFLVLFLGKLLTERFRTRQKNGTLRNSTQKETPEKFLMNELIEKKTKERLESLI